MTISILTAWAAVIFAVIAAAKYPVRKLGSKKLNAHFSKRHIIFGVLLVAAGLLHGIFAGNFPGASLADMAVAPPAASSQVSSQESAAPSSAAQSSAAQSSAAQSSAAQSSAAQSSAIQSSSVQSAIEASSAESLVSQAQTLFSGAELNDGVYTGSAAGYSGTVTVSVTVSGGKVTSISIVSQSDSQQYFSRASALTGTIIAGQTLEVNAVTGATYSSAGIVNAVADALSAAVRSGTLAVADINTSGGHGRR